MDITMIAPCGMNCGICLAHLRDKNICSGCRSANNMNKANYCQKCVIKNCELLRKTESKFCYECEKYPCLKLKQLDKRYRNKYNMSMIENLNSIKVIGLDLFIQNEHNRWVCKKCGGTICVHKGICLNCKKLKVK